MAKIYIDDIVHEVAEGKNLLDVCLSLGYNLPYFCWHPAMGSVGSCRQCAVLSFKDEKDTKGKLVMACMEPVKDGARISLNHDEPVEFRKNVIEWLMTNHPHDCPVCDEGGECHLQDMTVMTGHDYRRFDYKKRTYRNQYLGPFINHEMNRCIQCYRCVRFYRDYADGDDLDVFAAHNHVYFGRFEDGVLENEFSGNLVEICPTGVFTDKTLKKHYTRKWDMTNAPSVCVHCGLGCNTIAAERYGGLRRILSRFNHEVNDYFLCDRGRFGYEFVNHSERIRKGWVIREDGKTMPLTSTTEILEKTDRLISGADSMIGIGSPRASLESNLALRKLVGEDQFYAGMNWQEFRLLGRIQEIMKGPVPAASLNDVRNADAAFILGEDLTNTAPMMALAIRKAARNEPLKKAGALRIPEWQDAAVRELMQQERGPVMIATPHRTKLDNIASVSYRERTDNIARLGFAVAGAIDHEAAIKAQDHQMEDLAKKIGNNLMKAEKPVIVTGMSLMSESILEAAANVAWALKKKGKNCSMAFVVPECNSMGLRMMAGKSLDDIDLNGADAKRLMIVLENDLFRRMKAGSVNRIKKGMKHIIVLDHLVNRTVEIADLVIPAATFAGSDGTFVNNEGRAQRYYPVFATKEPVFESWRWISKLKSFRERSGENWENFDDFSNGVAAHQAIFRPVRELTPGAGFRINGQKITRQPSRYSGRTSKDAHFEVSEPRPPDDPDSPLKYSMEGYYGKLPPGTIPYFWSPGWNSQQAINKFQIEVGGPLKGGDPGKRLFEPSVGNAFSYYSVKEQGLPGVEKKDSGGKTTLIAEPLYFIFGSEELSRYAGGVSELTPPAAAGISSGTATASGLKNGDRIKLELDGEIIETTVKIMDDMARDVIMIPVGMGNFPPFIKDRKVILKTSEA